MYFIFYLKIYVLENDRLKYSESQHKKYVLENDRLKYSIKIERII